MKTILFRQVQIVDEASPFHNQVVDVKIEDGILQQIGKDLQYDPDKFDHILEGGCLSPGWIDMRVHLSDPGFEYKEDLDSLGRAALHGGFTSVVTLPNTHPVMENHGQVRALVSRSQDLPVRILPTGALSKGTEGKDLAELYDMGKAGAIAFTDGTRTGANAGLLLRGLQYLKSFHGLVIDTPTEADILPGVEVAEGISSTRVGLKGLPVFAETMPLDRAIQLMDYFPGRLHLGPLTSAAGLSKLRGEGHIGSGLSLETSVLYLWANQERIESFDPNFKVWPPLRSESDRLALLEALMDGTIEVVSSAHHPQSIEEKKHDFVRSVFGASTIEMAFSVCLTALQEAFPHQAEQALSRAVASFTAGPAKVLQLPDYTIAEGNRLDLTHFDAKSQRSIDKKAFHSKGYNQVFAGLSFTGLPLATVCKGELNHC